MRPIAQAGDRISDPHAMLDERRPTGLLASAIKVKLVRGEAEKLSGLGVGQERGLDADESASGSVGSMVWRLERLP